MDPPGAPPRPAAVPTHPPATAARPPAPANVAAPNAARVPTHEEAAAFHEAEMVAEADAVAHVVEDDDTLNLPAPPPESLGHHHRAAPPRAPRAPIVRTPFLKQTLIPPMLVLGFLWPAIAFWVMSLGDESPIAGSNWIPYTLIGLGVAVLGMAAFTMLQVRAQLNQNRKRADTAA